ncbi:MAG TPA: hypothetical protein VK589_28935, partial [Chryseolinea sp.]|nr:hypothetical protein [Chryseolinea sp.]
MNKNRIGCLFFLVGLLIHNASAQTNFIDGTVVTNESDTLRGQIDFQGWDRNPSVISFRNGSVVRTYSPAQIKSFMVSDVQYMSMILPVEQYSLQVKNMTTALNPGIRKDSVFLELLLTGFANLYYLNDRNFTPHFFYQVEGQEVKELSNYHFIKITDVGKKIVANPKRYLGTLNLLMNDCIDISVEKPGYKIADLKKLFTQYNQCKSPSSNPNISTRRKKLLFEPGIILGASLTSFSFEQGGSDEKATASPSANATFGFALNIVLPGNNRRWSINNELTYR